jgi:hypothetical protein
MIAATIDDGTSHAFHWIIEWKCPHFYAGKIHVDHLNLKDGLIKLLGSFDVGGWYFEPANGMFHIA